MATIQDIIDARLQQETQAQQAKLAAEEQAAAETNQHTLYEEAAAAGVTPEQIEQLKQSEAAAVEAEIEKAAAPIDTDELRNLAYALGVLTETAESEVEKQATAIAMAAAALDGEATSREEEQKEAAGKKEVVEKAIDKFQKNSPDAYKDIRRSAIRRGALYTAGAGGVGLGGYAAAKALSNSGQRERMNMYHQGKYSRWGGIFGKGEKEIAEEVAKKSRGKSLLITGGAAAAAGTAGAAGGFVYGKRRGVASERRKDPHQIRSAYALGVRRGYHANPYQKTSNKKGITEKVKDAVFGPLDEIGGAATGAPERVWLNRSIAAGVPVASVGAGAYLGTKQANPKRTMIQRVKSNIDSRSPKRTMIQRVKSHIDSRSPKRTMIQRVKSHIDSRSR